ncbi:hypothetical protein APHAL10511_007975 [Amanita phalloides]|nr:hypothetical protein APHAL10511_007975 [Amanita phalloides]
MKYNHLHWVGKYKSATIPLLLTFPPGAAMTGLDLTEVGLVNDEFYSGDNFRLIKSAIENIEKTIKVNKASQESVEQDIAGLIQHHESLLQQGQKLADDLDRLRRALAPFKRLSAELQRYIFILASNRSVGLPYRKQEIPRQMIISHVSSSWRHVALNTSELWSNVYIRQPEKRLHTRLYRRWLARGCSASISLKINLEDCEQHDLRRVFRTLVSPFEPRKLKLDLSSEQLTFLAGLPTDLHDMPYLQELKLNISSEYWITVQNVPSFISKTRSIRLLLISNAFPDMERSCLPWNQLRCLDSTDTPPVSVPTCLKILREMPLLEKCGLHIYCFAADHDPSGDKITMRHLRYLDFKFDLPADGCSIDSILRRLILPNLAGLNINGHGLWTTETYSIIVQQFNLHRLIHLQTSGHIPLSRVLMDAPMLQTLCISSDIMIDDRAIIGLSTAQLGKHLQDLYIYCDPDDVDEVLRMLEARVRISRKSVESSRNWEDVVTFLRNVGITPVQKRGHQGDHASRIAALREAGVNVELHL